MDWSRIKTIFILTFLILDVYLLYQFMKIRDANKYEIITEASFEDKLKADEIKYVELPKIPIKDQYVSAKPKIFKNEDVAKFKEQTIIIQDGYSLHSSFENPIQISTKFDTAELYNFVKKNVLYGDHYVLWEKNDKKNTITFFQQYEEKTLYKNINGMLTIHFNNENQVVAYEQTYLEGIERLTEKGEILPPLKAIETLHQKGMLKPKSKITRVELGYSTLIQLSASQVLAPTWHIVVDDKESLFVNAFEGQIIDFSGEKKE